MKAHSKDSAVQEEGIDALVNIADSKDGKKRPTPTVLNEAVG